MKQNISAALVSATLATLAATEPIPRWEDLDSGVAVSLRGLSVVDADVAWASGENGTVLRTTDGGRTWERLPKIQHEGRDVTSDFRDVVGFDADSAVVLGIDSPAFIFKTADGGKTWTRGYYSEDPDVFLDAFDFWDDKFGLAFGDAINGKLFVLSTEDGGSTWQQLDSDRSPDVADGQGGFAASGTCLVVNGESSAYIGLGEVESTLLYTHDKGATWNKTVAPIQSGDPSSGINSIAFKNSLEGVVVGGNYDGDELTVRGQNLAVTADGGNTWKAVDPELSPNGYRSCIAYFGSDLLLAVGRQSSDYGRQDLAGEFKLMAGKFHTVATNKFGAEKVAFASGPEGKIARLVFD